MFVLTKEGLPILVCFSSLNPGLCTSPSSYVVLAEHSCAEGVALTSAVVASLLFAHMTLGLHSVGCNTNVPFKPRGLETGDALREHLI